MSDKPFAEFSPQDWGKRPSNTTIGDCVIEVTHDSEEPPRVISVLAHPVTGHKDSGSFIHCFLPFRGSSDIAVNPSIAAYWSSRRKGPGARYFYQGHPGLTLSILHALETNELRDRTRALLYLFITPSGYAPEPGEGVTPLMHDLEGFRRAAAKWIARLAQSEEGLKELTSARKILEGAKRYNSSLSKFEALLEPEKADANPTQSAVLLAIRNAAEEVSGIPLRSEVQRAYHNIVILQSREHRQRIQRDPSAKEPAAKPTPLRLKGFDTAVKNLGFSWLPKSWS